ncbi:MAG TPA: hypothetical protein VFJ13_07780 [Paracoccaceae bacterium]|nr:hypothetical protein [Paracoccaceae bacterium]
MDYNERVARNRRLVILRALSGENDGRMNETLLGRELDHFGHACAHDEVRELLRWLERVDAVRITMAGGTIMVAGITRRGQDHIDRRGAPIEGVDRPSRL